jgi:glycosyltransferase involved in cell wall biosynthesis
MNNLPLVTIGIPVYNRVDLVEETINSALNQTYENIEIIVCDNVSTDGTWGLLNQILQKDKRIKIYKNEANLGAVKNWQTVFNKATGDFFLMLWSDDLIDQKFVERTLHQFDENTAFVMTGFSTFFEKNNVKKITYTNNYQGLRGISSEEYFEEILLLNKLNFPPSPSCALFRKNDLENVITNQIYNNEEIDFNLTGAGPDMLFFLMPALKYSTIKVIPEALLLNRSHENSISVLNETRLNLYYDWAKYYFIKNYKPLHLQKFKSMIFYKKQKFKQPYFNIYIDLSSVKLNLIYLIRYSYSRMLTLFQ